MKKKSSKYSAFFEPRVFVSFLLLFGGAILAMSGFGVSAQGQAAAPKLASVAKDGPVVGAPDVVRMVGPYSEERDLRDLPYILPNMEEEDVRLMRHPLPMTPSTEPPDPLQVVREHISRALALPTPSR